MKVRTQSANKTKPFWEEPDKPQLIDQKGPLVLVSHGVKGTRISAVGPEGEREGLWPGMKLADARSMLPNLDVVSHDIQADHALLSRLALWMMRYSPAVAVYHADGFILDVTGCTHLFGGEEALAYDLAARFRQMGFSTRIAFANTLAACHTLVHHSDFELNILPQNHAADILDALPIEALRLEEATIILLKRLGLKHIGDVRALPRPALERRFRENAQTRSKQNTQRAARSVQWRLDQLAGIVPEPLSYIKEPQRFRVTKPCPELALELGAIGIALDELLPELCDVLSKFGKGGRRFQLTGYRADGGLGSTQVMMSQPINKSKVIRSLFNDRLDRIDCGYGIDLFVLEALGAEIIHSNQHDMMNAEGAQQSSISLATFADTVGNRVESKAVMKLTPCTSHVPERAQRLVDVTTSVEWQVWNEMQPKWSPRPLRLLQRPERADVTAEMPDSPPAQFVWRRVLRRVVRSRGPERIMPEWWNDDLKAKRSATFRDYYDVEDTEGRRYWLFRSIKDEPLEGDDAPKESKEEDIETLRTIHWFVHGLF